MSARAAWRLESLGFDRVFRYTPGKADWLAAGLPTEGPESTTPRAGDAVRRDVPTCTLTDRLADVHNRLRDSGWTSCIVVNDHRVVLGRLRESALSDNPDATAESVMEPGPTTIRPSEPLKEFIERMQKRRVGSIILTTPEGELIGVLKREDGQRRLEETRT
jgi:CBS domain-containing protein